MPGFDLPYMNITHTYITYIKKREFPAGPICTGFIKKHRLSYFDCSKFDIYRFNINLSNQFTPQSRLLYKLDRFFDQLQRIWALF